MYDTIIVLRGRVCVLWDSINNGRIGPITVTHYNDIIMGAIASQITSLTIVYSIVYWDADQRKQQSTASLAFARGIHRGPVNSPHKWPVTRKMFPLMTSSCTHWDFGFSNHRPRNCLLKRLCSTTIEKPPNFLHYLITANPPCLESTGIHWMAVSWRHHDITNGAIGSMEYSLMTAKY